MRLLSVLLLAVQLFHNFAWRLYEEPIQPSHPNQDGIYDIELVVQHKISMTRRTGNGLTEVVDYDPEKSLWLLRDSNPDMMCDKNAPFLNSSASEMHYIEELGDLVQHTGRHVRVVTLNGVTPGNTIAVPLGAEVRLKVRNELDRDAITIHLHGVDKKNLWYTDGVAFIQQCPITAGSSHTYRSIADTAGTQWFHGHLMNDRADGLLGGFLIVPTDSSTFITETKRVQTTREYYMILQDWATLPSKEQWFCHVHMTMKWVGHGYDDEAKNKCWAPKRTYDGSNVGGSVPLLAILINSKGWYSQEDLRQRPQKLPLTTYKIRRNEHQRYRIVNGGISQGIMVWCEEHEMTVVAADGVEVKPRKVDAIILFSGERYDVHIQGLNSPTRPVYRFIFETMEYFNWNWSIGTPQIGIANLFYEDMNEKLKNKASSIVDFTHSQCTANKKCQILNCPFKDFPPNTNMSCISSALLENSEPVKDGEILEKKMFRDNFREIFANMHFDNHMDGYMFKSPIGMPYYHHDNLEEISQPCDPYKCDRFSSFRWDHNCDCFYHYTFKLGEIVQMTIYNMGDGGKLGDGYSHPLHIHGTHFYVMKIGYPIYNSNNMTIKAMNPDIPCFDMTKRCVDLRWTDPSWSQGNVPGMQQNPSYRDTVNLPTGGYVTIRFRASNPGWWYAHCHLMLHHMGGTAFSFRIGEHDQIPSPPDNFPHSCGIYNNKFGGEQKAGGATFTPSFWPFLFFTFITSFLKFFFLN